MHVFMHIAVLLLSSAAPSLGRSRADEPPQPCQAPLQWEGRSVRYEHSTGRNTRAIVSYDGQNQRIRVLEEKKGHIPCKRFFEYIYIYQSAVLFQIEQVTKQCSKIALTEAWDPYDIPDNSTYEDQYFIGGPGDTIQVQEWSDRKPARKRSRKFYHHSWTVTVKLRRKFLKLKTIVMMIRIFVKCLLTALNMMTMNLPHFLIQ